MMGKTYTNLIRMGKIYANLVKDNLKGIDEVPPEFKEQVLTILAEEVQK